MVAVIPDQCRPVWAEHYTCVYMNVIVILTLSFCSQYYLQMITSTNWRWVHIVTGMWFDNQEDQEFYRQLIQ